jgi:hypothetical protein
MSDILDQNDLDALSVLVDCMEVTPPLSDRTVARLHRAHMRKVVPTMLAEGKTYGEASGGALSLLNRPDAQEFVKSIDDGLGENVAIVSASFSEYLETSQVPAPFYAWRICVILRKAKEIKTELRFLDAWARHFATRGIGHRYEMLANRRAGLRSKFSEIVEAR